MDENLSENKNIQEKNEEQNPDENPKDTENNQGNIPDIDELREKLEQAQQMLIREKNRQVFARASQKAGIRQDRIEAAMKLSGVDSITDSIDDATARELAEKILANYPEFSDERSPLETDQGLPGTSRTRAKMSGDPLEILRILRKG